MQYANYILTQLLHKYESSKAFSDGKSQRRIALQPLNDAVLAGKLENVDEKDACLAALADLAQQGIIAYNWKKFEQGNLLDKVWLLYNDTTALSKAYELAKMQPKQQLLQELAILIEAALRQQKLLPWLKQFYEAMLEQIKTKHKAPTLLTGDLGLISNIIKVLTVLNAAQSGEEILERVFSLRLYGNSKYFEKFVKNRLYSILKQYLLAEWPDEVTKDFVFAQVGIVKWPEVMEFCGSIQAILADDNKLDYQAEKFGAYINSKLANQVTSWQLEAINKIIFIENKANYTWYIENIKATDELVIYHGGQYSPVRGRFFCAITQAASNQTKFYHWSDIDIGGFIIFNRLQKIVPQLQPYRMDETAFTTMQKYGEFMDKAYCKKLARLLEDSDYTVFHGVIRLMLASNKRIEQECFLV